ncbi:MAG: patatin-like protein [Parvibaculum sp.]|uniref:patatin-like protein n=1 Tax=Parvibaculum sp. TaxID=2024848 RepID=UPI002731F42C|nr:patatin-like protein [Parvibaculum sp.]MDP2150653.1 patatin-like protein [Parvibaculum sp.]
MKEKELRLALVCYGGVSLAVYMHGVTKEILKLVRASRVYHQDLARSHRPSASYSDVDHGDARETDTEKLYFELIQAIGETVELRIFVDTIAGASAGGINGVLLARALAHDLPMDSHRKMWLEQADIVALMDEAHLAKRWDKLFMKPLFWGFTDKWLARFAPDVEMRQKLQLFTRSRWFQPPFSGAIMSGMLLDACVAMEEDVPPTSSLLPGGHRLDLIVSVTDFHGYSQNIPLHDPVSIREREHRHILKFSYFRHPSGLVESDFDRDHIPGLAFAARATSSFPGAFPPTRIGEIDAALATRDMDWPTREEFLHGNFKPLIAAGSDPAKASFIDGSVLNNKPFAEAIASIRGRPAYREVDRRVVYIDPDPKGGHVEAGGAAPGFFQTIRGALSDIPRNQPVRDELESLHDFSERVRRYRQIVSATRPHVTERVRQLFNGDAEAPPTPALLAKLRNKANAQSAIEAGYAYDAYIQLKVSSVLDQITDVIARLSEAVHHPSDRLALSRVVEAWAKQRNIFPVLWSQHAGEGAEPSKQDAWVRFLREFDINFRVRRLRFVIRRLNELYARNGEADGTDCLPDALDDFKASLYMSLERLQSESAARLRTPDVRAICKAIYEGGLAETQEIDHFTSYVASQLDLVGLDGETDESFAQMANACLPPAARTELVQAYVGFPFFDVLTLSLNKWQDLDDVDTVLVDRISPEDAKALREGGAPATLMGRDLGYFAAFFSRRARENDYLWGRLHAADRLVDIVASAAPAAIHASGLDLDQLKARMFRSILKAELPFLENIPDLFNDLEREIVIRFGEERTDEKASTAEKQAPQDDDGDQPVSLRA